MTKYPLLDDENWLRQKYLEERLHTTEICKLVGAKSPNSVRQALIRFGIPRRIHRKALDMRREDDGNCFILDEEVINGCLLGDASLVKFSPWSSNSYPHIKKKNKYLSHVEYVAKLLFSSDWGARITEDHDKRFDRVYYILRSLAQPELSPLYEIWYPSPYRKKVLPKTLELTPVILLHWFMDDGSTYRRRPNSRTKQVVVNFSSECFTKEENQRLVEQLNDVFSIRAYLRKVKTGTGYRVEIGQSSYEEFIDVIGACPVEEMKYKWK